MTIVIQILDVPSFPLSASKTLVHEALVTPKLVVLLKLCVVMTTMHALMITVIQKPDVATKK